MPRFEKRLETALELEVPYSFGRRPKLPGTPAAVLALFSSEGAEPSLLLTRRTETVETHKGQIAFPGGVGDPADEAAGGSVATALRETEEELGIPPARVRVLGRLPELWTTTGFLVTPVVGIVAAAPGDVPLRLNPHEIAEAFWVPLPRLTAPETYRREEFRVGPAAFPIDVFQLGPHRVWGATGSIIKNLLDRLDRVE